MKQAGKLFVTGFMKSFVAIFLIILVGVLSYKTVIHLFHIPQEEAVVAFQPVLGKDNIGREASIDDVSKNLIYCWDDETDEIIKIILEIFHCENRKLYYITIPVRTQITLSDTLYKKLVLVNPAIPQVMKLSTLSDYFPEDTIYDYGVMVLEDLLDIQISYYTVIPQTIYKDMFVTKDALEVFSEEYKAFLHTVTSEELLKNYIYELYIKVRSNLSVMDKMNYLDSYLRIGMEDISFDLLVGENKNSGYFIDMVAASKQLSAYIGDTAGSGLK